MGGMSPGMGPGMSPGMGQGMGGPSGQAPKKKRDPNAPETHAASGSGEELGVLPSIEAALPPHPLELSDDAKKRIGTDADPESEPVRGGRTERRFYGPYYEERSNQYRFRTLFPLWFQRDLPNDTASLYSPLYYRRRSKEHDADVVFPLYWDLRQGDSRTRVIGPVAWRRTPDKSDTWLAPLVFQGSRGANGGYLHIPPLLTFTHHTATSGFNLVGPGFCSWKGGSTCSLRSAESLDLGVFPFYFYGKTDRSEYEVVPPLLHYYRYDDIGEKSLNIWGPLLWKHSRTRDAFDILPLVYHIWGQDEDHLTVLPFFHKGHKGNASLFVNPLFLTARGDHGESTFVTWGYARYRGRTELDMITPLYWDFRDPDVGSHTRILLPFLYSSQSPRESNFAIFPFWGHFDRFGISKTTWVTPLFEHTHSITGWETNIHPVLYLSRYQDSSHTVVFPFFYDFASPRARSTVVFPFYWRFDDGESMSQLALNTYYRERKVRQGKDWEFHFFPAFSYGETPTGHWWKVLYGLAGYTRTGATTRMYAGWVPITLSGGDTGK